jgi:HK97 gp10 family phage protein
MKATFSLTGWSEMMKTFNAVGVKLDDKDPAVKQAILPAASAMIANAQSLAPIAKEVEGKGANKYPPGTLKRSLIATPGPATQRGIFLVARKRVAPYAVYVEFGTSKMSPQPFFRPAFLQMASTYASDIAPAVARVIETACAENAYHPPA